MILDESLFEDSNITEEEFTQKCKEIIEHKIGIINQALDSFGFEVEYVEEYDFSVTQDE